MLFYLLGIITGILLVIPSLIIGLWVKPKVERTFRQIVSQTKEKGQIFEEDETKNELENWISSLDTE